MRLLLLTLLLATGCANVRYGGRVALDGRAFLRPAAIEGQSQGSGPSFLADPSFSVQSDNGQHTATVQPFIRADLQDRERTHFDLRQADYVFARGPAELGFGVGTFTWGVMEAHRPVDIINQRDLVEDFEGQAKLGQPYARVGLFGGDFSFEALALPVHRPRTYPGEEGRLRGYLPVDDEPLYDQDLGAFYPSVAARIAMTRGEFDLGISGFSGIGREPRFFAQLTSQRVNASYERLHHAGLDLQWTTDAITLKFEGVVRWWSEDRHFSFAAALGAERAFLDLGGADLILVAEYHMDNRGPDQPFTVYDNDVFGGFRLALNDDAGTALGAGALVDLFTGQTYLRASAERRLHENWKAALEAHVFFGSRDGNGRLESALLADHFLQARVAYYF